MRPLPSLDEIRMKVHTVTGKQQSCNSMVESLSSEISHLEAEEEILDVTAAGLRTLIDQEVELGVEAIEKLLSEGLQTIFGDMDISVSSEVSVQRGRVSVDLVTTQVQPNGITVSAASTEAYGGSVTTVQSLLLRIIVLLKNNLRPFLLLDETCSAIEGNYIPATARFLSQLCDKLGLDILLITHNKVLVEQANKAYRIKNINGVANFDAL